MYYSGPEHYYLAEFAAFSLEAAYEQLKRDFRHEIADRIEVILYASHSEFSETNTVPLPLDAQGIGGVTDKFKNRITMPFQGDYAEFRRVLHHELIHAIVNDMYYGRDHSVDYAEQYSGWCSLSGLRKVWQNTWRWGGIPTPICLFVMRS